MKVFLLKCLLEGDQLAFIDIQINADHTLKQLHECLLSGAGFSGMQMASFYEINDDYEVLSEVSLEQLTTEGKTMAEVNIQDIFEQEGDQLLYTYDFLSEYKFTIECMEVRTAQVNRPTVFKKMGQFPKEEEIGVSNKEAESILINAIMGDAFEEEEEDDFDEFESFDALDDYEEFL